MVKIIVSGIAGRMGMRIGALGAADKDIEVAGALEAKDHASVGKDIGNVLSVKNIGKSVADDLEKIKDSPCVLIEFTSAPVTMAHLQIATKKKIGMVIGTTAISHQEIEKIKDASKKIPIVFSPNMSIGANLLFRLTEEASRSLGKDYSVEIIEAHHNKKKDAPSGTAKRLGEAVSSVRGKEPPIKSIREGDIVGDHVVIFKNKNETIELKHVAHSRDTFAQGALDAAKFLAGKKSGLYTMQDVI